MAENDPGEQGEAGKTFERKDVYMLEQPYALRGEDFLRLTKIPSFLAIWAHTLASGAAIYISRLVILHFVAVSNEDVSPVSDAEWIFVYVLAAAVVILQFVNLIWPNERNKTKKKIQRYFEEQSDAQTVVEKGK